MSVSSDEFKLALRSWPSGVTVVTACHDAQLHGMTVSSFASVSLSPPLISVCLDKSSRTLAMIEASGVFGVCILGRAQQAVSNHFASSKTEDERFSGIAYARGNNGCPLIDDALAQLECSVFASHEAGDHQLIIGKLTRAIVSEGEPLGFCAGAYGEFQSLSR